MFSFVIRLWIPDRPGALGLVAAALGRAEADVVGIEILERGGGNAIDEITVTIQQATTAGIAKDALIEQLRTVDGVAVEDVRQVGEAHVDTSASALEGAVALVECDPADRLPLLCVRLAELIDGEWTVVISNDGAEPLAASGNAPDLAWLAAFVLGSKHLDGHHDTTPGDMVWARLDRWSAVVVGGRSGRPFHARERQQVSALARVVDALAQDGSDVLLAPSGTSRR